MKKDLEQWQIKHDYKFPNGKIVHCIYEKALKLQRKGKFGWGEFKEVITQLYEADREQFFGVCQFSALWRSGENAGLVSRKEGSGVD